MGLQSADFKRLQRVNLQSLARLYSLLAVGEDVTYYHLREPECRWGKGLNKADVRLTKEFRTLLQKMQLEPRRLWKSRSASKLLQKVIAFKHPIYRDCYRKCSISEKARAILNSSPIRSCGGS